MKSDSETSHLINGLIKDGKIVPSEITTGLLLKAMRESSNTRFLIDGYPRNMENLDCWNSIVAPHCDLQFLLYLECPEEVMLQRLIGRAAFSGRTDDNEETIRKRFATNTVAIAPLLETFTASGLIRPVDSNRPVAEVFADVSVLFQEV